MTDTAPEGWRERLATLLGAARGHVTFPLERDYDTSDGEYGSGPDTHSGYRTPYIMDARGRRVFLCDGNEIACIREEYDEDGCTAFDEASYAVADLVVAAVNALPAALAENARLREALEPFAKACAHLHPSQPDDGETLDGFKVSDFRRASAALSPPQGRET